jgi:protein-export SecD/SecF family membrane protein
MAKERSLVWPIFTSVLGVLIAFLALPQSFRSGAPGFLQSPRIHLGLDLAGGTQLDFRISEQEMLDQKERLEQEIATLKRDGASSERIAHLEQQMTSIEELQRTILEAIRTVLERRINSLGVSEATITPSVIGSEKHLLVECPGVVDVQQCIATIGKTIALEFKEEQTEATEEFGKEVRSNVANAQRRISGSGITLTQLSEDYSGKLGVQFFPEAHFFRDTLPKGLEDLWARTPPTGVLRREGSITITSQDEEGETATTEVPGIFLSEVTRARTQTGRLINEAPRAFALLSEREGDATYRFREKQPLDASVPARTIGTIRAMKPGDLRSVTMEDGSSRIFFLRSFVPGREEVRVSHILLAYKGATQAPGTVIRTKEEALRLAHELKNRLSRGESFLELARRYSDGESAAQGGSLDPIGRGTMIASFEQAAFSQSEGTVSAPVETQFGYHLIRTDKSPATTSDVASYDELSISGDTDGTRANALLGALQRGEVMSTEEAIDIRSLFFSLLPTGWKDTALDGKHFRSATVTLDPLTNIPVVQIVFDDEGGKLFQELTKRNVGKRLAIFVGGDLISAPTVQDEIIGGTAIITGARNFDEARQLALDLNTGAIPAPIFLAGQRTVEAAGVGIVLLMLMMLIFYRALGVVANLALGLYAVLYFVLMKVPLFFFSGQYVVLTLAGMAGIILSTGMAVDANVLIFERVKEELRKGRNFALAIETGFEKAWPSIRDGNVSTLITCVILFSIGTSIVRGFAITLGLGVFLSMFTAIIVTKWLARKIAATPMAGRPELFGVKSVHP